MEERMKSIEDQMATILQLLQDKSTDNPQNHETGAPNTGINPNRTLGFNPKVNFPVFDGSNPRMWLKKCARYFELCKIPEHQKIDLASLYMIGKTELWVHGYLAVRRNVDWDDFKTDLCARFREETDSNVVEQFNKLHQTGSIDEYIDSFENLRGLMFQINLLLPDQYFLDSFVGGLKPVTKPFVKAFRPTTIAQAVEHARLQEESINATKKSAQNNIRKAKS
ncbi:uncharacterized protein LOC141640775 [Silene latifolia]|uniref:uncharacterized protein LOC141640775 n=1 Tax=Silene latifolia TaxID=37657 RepID=UPI003D771039